MLAWLTKESSFGAPGSSGSCFSRLIDDWSGASSKEPPTSVQDGGCGGASASASATTSKDRERSRTSVVDPSAGVLGGKPKGGEPPPMPWKLPSTRERTPKSVAKQPTPSVKKEPVAPEFLTREFLERCYESQLQSLVPLVRRLSNVPEEEETDEERQKALFAEFFPDLQQEVSNEIK